MDIREVKLRRTRPSENVASKGDTRSAEGVEVGIIGGEDLEIDGRVAGLE